MKKLYYLFSGLAFCLVLFASCDNEILEGEFAASGDDSVPANCTDATMILSENIQFFANATDENFEVVCNEYKDALQGLLDSCQDEFDQDFIDQLQALILAVGDCSVDQCLLAETTSAAAGADFNNATEDNEDVFCEAFTIALQAEIQACGDANGNIQQTINNLPCSDCGAAQADTEAALIAFNEADPLNEIEYELLCGFYSMALQAQITECGDSDGTLMTIVLDLGDCTPPEEDGPVRLQLDGQMKNFNTADVTISGSTLSVVATDLDTGDTFKFDIVLQQTGTNVMQNTELTFDGVVHTPFLSGDTPFVNIITENSGTTIIGTFTGTITNSDGDFVMTSEGIIDIEY